MTHFLKMSHYREALAFVILLPAITLATMPIERLGLGNAIRACSQGAGASSHVSGRMSPELNPPKISTACAAPS